MAYIYALVPPPPLPPILDKPEGKSDEGYGDSSDTFETSSQASCSSSLSLFEVSDGEEEDEEVEVLEVVQKVQTPFGVFRQYPVPNPSSFKYEPTSGYYYDKTTGFYHDKKTGYYFNCGTKEWLFYSRIYCAYVPCHGGDVGLKKELQLWEKACAQVQEGSPQEKMENLNSRV